MVRGRANAAKQLEAGKRELKQTRICFLEKGTLCKVIGLPHTLNRKVQVQVMTPL